MEATCLFSLSLQKEVYMIAAGVIGGVFLVCTVVMFLGVKERDGEAFLSRSAGYSAVDRHKNSATIHS